MCARACASRVPLHNKAPLRLGRSLLILGFTSRLGDLVFHLEVRRPASGESAWVSLFVGEAALSTGATEQSYSFVCPVPSSLADENGGAISVRVICTKRVTGESALLYSSDGIYDEKFPLVADLPLARIQVVDVVPQLAHFCLQPSMAVAFDREAGACTITSHLFEYDIPIELPLSSATSVLEHFVEFA